MKQDAFQAADAANDTLKACRPRRIRRWIAIAGLGLILVAPSIVWSKRLHLDLPGADSVSVRSMCHGNEPPVEVHDRVQIERLERLLHVSMIPYFGQCKCRGHIFFDFRAKNTPIAQIGYSHGYKIKWREGLWPFDGVLTDRSRAEIERWMADNGVPLCAHE